MKQLLSDAIKENKVLFIPQQKLEILPSWVAMADFLYLSLNDSKLFRQTVPAKLQGYMAMGKPILAILAGEGANIINEAKCGFIASPNNINELKAIIKNALKSTEIERKIWEIMEKSFTKSTFHQLLEEEN